MDARAAQIARRFRRDQDVAADQPEIPNVRQPRAVPHVSFLLFKGRVMEVLEVRLYATRYYERKANSRCRAFEHTLQNRLLDVFHLAPCIILKPFLGPHTPSNPHPCPPWGWDGCHDALKHATDGLITDCSPRPPCLHMFPISLVQSLGEGRARRPARPESAEIKGRDGS